MIARVIALSVAALLGFAGAAMADAPGTTGPIVVPPDEPTPPPPPPAPRSTTGTIELEKWSVAVGIGAVWGTGTVNYNGRDYDIKVGGFDLIDAGFAKSIGTGVVQNLESIGAQLVRDEDLLLLLHARHTPPKRVDTLCPPNPKVLQIALRILAGRTSFGT